MAKKQPGRKPPGRAGRDGKKSAGRPLKFKTVAGLQKAIDEYFAQCKKDLVPVTITGLALHLDTTRQTLIDYERRDQFTDTIKKAKLRCENYAEIQLFQGRNVAGVIFNMKNNYNWQDKREIDTRDRTMMDILDELEGGADDDDDGDDDDADEET